MSDRGDMGPEDLEFDEAGSDDGDSPGSPTCGACRREIIEDYYATNGVIVCEPCRMLIENARGGGSGLGRFFRASALGTLAAIAGFALYFGILKTTGYEVGLVAILVGLMVGKGVRLGSRGRGGWLYQLLAMFFVYAAVVASHSAVAIPQMLAEMAAKEEAEEAAEKAGPAKAAPDAKAAENGKPADPGPEAKAAPAADVKEIKPPNPPEPWIGVVGMLALAVFVVGFFFALPIIAGFQAPMGLLILGFALWEAWKINRRTKIVFSGPYRVGDSPAPGASAYA